MAFERYLAEEIAVDHRDGLLSRREALGRLALLGLGTGPASALLAACSGDDGGTAAPTTTSTPPGSPTSATGPATSDLITFAGPGGDLRGAFAAPPTDPKGSVLVIHENRGLTDHFRAFPARLAGDGYSALAVDLLSPEGGTAFLRRLRPGHRRPGRRPPGAPGG